jgi:hypothetical protein
MEAPGRAPMWLKRMFFSWMNPSGTNSVKPPLRYQVETLCSRLDALEAERREQS